MSAPGTVLFTLCLPQVWSEPPSSITEDDMIELLASAKKFNDAKYPGLDPTKVKGVRSALVQVLLHGAPCNLVVATPSEGTQYRRWATPVKWDSDVFCPAWFAQLFDRAKLEMDREALS